MWTKIDGRGLTVAEHEKHVQTILPFPGCSGMTLHNTGAPNLKQAKEEDAPTRIGNYERYYRDEQGWSAGPHAFVYAEKIWLFTPYNHKGTHSPSWNGTKFGIEMTGDYGVDDPTTGRGLQIVRNAAALFAHWHTRMHWDPETIKMHKEDPRTTHDCPGRKLKKDDFINMVQEYMGHAGEVAHEEISTDPIAPAGVTRFVNTPGDTLNMREQSSASSRTITVLTDKTPVKELSTAMNGKTKWSRVEAHGNTGWVATAYLK